MADMLVDPSMEQSEALYSKELTWQWFHLLPMLAGVIYIFTPILSWKLGVPGGIRFLGDGAGFAHDGLF